MLKGIYSSKGTYVRVEKEITKFCNKISMKVNLLVEFNGEKQVPKNITLTAILMFPQFKTMRLNFYKCNCHVPDKCKKEKVTICAD